MAIIASMLPRLLVSVLFVISLASQDSVRLHTNRDGRQLLKLPKEDDAFGFVVFGDRTGGPPEGIEVLKQAVHDTNLLDPDLVLTVGDLVNGYNDSAKWQAQAAEYKAAMSKLRMPWFPVAGNHDIYWRGEGKPPGEHEKEFEATFGPLWYALQHKKCWFIVLYSDEGDPKTGKKDFGEPACQKFSDAQFEWLQATLQQAKGARHVFLFLHHPRWLSDRYPGADWDRVHALLAKNGNVTAVFAGHIHRMRFDGVRDGIQYYTVASVGAFLEMEAPQAGYLHEFHVVTVRPEGIQVAALPVGTVIDPKAITGEISEDTDRIHALLRAENLRGIEFAADGAVDSMLQMEFANPARRPVELTIVPGGAEEWSFSPDHTHTLVPAGQRTSVAFAVRRRAGTAAALPTLPHLLLRAEYLATGLRIALPEKRQEVAVLPPAVAVPEAGTDGALRLSGKRGSCLSVAAQQLHLPDGPLTVETWLCGDDFGGRRAVVAKTESSEFGLFASDGRVAFLVHVGGAYVTAETADPALQKGRWHHVAGVFDGTEVRAYVDGKQVGRAAGKGARRSNELPLFLGADPDKDHNPMSLFTGQLDEVRISKAARYAGESFAPQRRFTGDDDTVLLLHLDQDAGSFAPDSSPNHAHALRRGDAHCAPR